MPRFYFHLHNDIESRDEEGRDFPDLDAATAYARDIVRFEAAEAVKLRGHFVQNHHVDIEDDQGRICHTVRFGDVIQIDS